MKKKFVILAVLVVCTIAIASVALAQSWGNYDRTYNANSYFIYSTLHTKQYSTNYMTNENDTCRRVSDNSQAGFYTTAWSENNNNATEYLNGSHGDTVNPKFRQGFGAIDAKYKLEMGNPNGFQVRMVGRWTPN